MEWDCSRKQTKLCVILFGIVKIKFIDGSNTLFFQRFAKVAYRTRSFI